MAKEEYPPILSTLISKDDLEICFSLEPEEAIKFLRKKKYAISDNWRESLAIAKERGFTIAGVATLDILAQAQESLAVAMAEGLPARQWAKTIEPQLVESGWLQSNPTAIPSRLDLIFRNATQNAFAAGRQLVMEELEDFRPYFRILFVKDSRQSDTCKRMQAEVGDKVFRVGDPAAKMFIGPSHHRCRKDTETLSERQLKARGYSVIQDANKVKNKPDDGFDHSPREPFKPDLKKYDKEHVKDFKAEQKEKAKEIIAASPNQTKEERKAAQLASIKEQLKRLREGEVVKPSPKQKELIPKSPAKLSTKIPKVSKGAYAKEHADWLASLSEEQELAIEKWQDSSSPFVMLQSKNRRAAYKREVGASDEAIKEMMDKAKPHAAILDEIMGTAPRFTGLAYRGMSDIPPAVISQYMESVKSGKPITLETHSSASAKRSVTNSFNWWKTSGDDLREIGLIDTGNARVQLVIESQTGVNITGAKKPGTQEVSTYDAMKEVVLRQGSQYQITGVEDVSDDPEFPKYIVSMKEVAK